MLLYVLECNSGKQDKCMYLLSILWLKVGNVVIQTSIFTNKSWTFMIVYKNDLWCICICILVPPAQYDEKKRMNDPVHAWSLKLESKRTRGHPDRSWDVQDNCLTTFAEHLALKMVIFPVKIIPIHQVWSWSQTRTSLQPDNSLGHWLHDLYCFGHWLAQNLG